MIDGIEAIEFDDPAEAGVDWQEEDVDRERREERMKEAREKSVFVLQLNLVVDREARF